MVLTVCPGRAFKARIARSGEGARSQPVP
jgi:hypothetical protein